jgi:hypothetical protein
MSEESFDIRDMPDNWFDVIQAEGNAFFERMAPYPPELVIMLIQVIFQNYVYVCLPAEDRGRFLHMVVDTFMNQFEEWQQEDDQEADTN